jgi:circadian clock protein KaiB
MTPNKARLPPTRRSSSPRLAHWRFCLYVAGQSPKSLAAIANLQRLCRDHFPDTSSIEVIDLLANPALAERDQIIAIPTLVRRCPQPTKTVIGDLSNTERVLAGLDAEPNPGHFSTT